VIIFGGIQSKELNHLGTGYRKKKAATRATPLHSCPEDSTSRKEKKHSSPGGESAKMIILDKPRGGKKKELLNLQDL